MITKFFIPILCACSLCCAAQANVQANHPSTKTAETKNIHSAAEEAIALAREIDQRIRKKMQQQHVTEHSDPKITAQIAREEILPHIAQTTIARLVLGPQAWKQADPAEQKAFAKVLTETIINAYAAALTSYSKPTAKQDFSPPRISATTAGDPSRVEINSVIKTAPDAPPVRISYRLIKEPGSKTFQVYDINGENISLVKSYRSQIQGKLSQGQSLTSITKELEQHNKNPKTS